MASRGEDAAEGEEEDERFLVEYKRWRTLIPILYDWFAHHHTVWPSLACRWGRLLPAQSTHKTKQRLYYSEQTDGSTPNTLIVANADVIKPRVASADNVARRWSETGKSPYVRKVKTIFHPGEVNKIRDIFTDSDKDWVATHSDCPEVYVWNIEQQTNRTEKGGSRAELSAPDLLLKGHKENAEFALAASRTAPAVASGGKDKLVCLWSLADAVSASLAGAEGDAAGRAEAAAAGRSSWNSGGGGGAAPGGRSVATLEARAVFEGHAATVEDVAFHPASDAQLCSVGDDSALLFWDARKGRSAAATLAGAHAADVHCCDWSGHDDNLVLTGSADNTVRLFDRRKAGGGAAASALVHTFVGHTDAISVVSYCPDQRGVFASGGKDGIVNVWDTARIEAAAAPGAPPEGGAPELLFQHAGHRAEIVDLQWNPAAPWTLLSASDDNATSGGGTLQLWRMLDLIYSPLDAVVAELEANREAIVGRRPAAAAGPDTAMKDAE